MVTDTRTPASPVSRSPVPVSDTLSFLLTPGLRIGRLRYLARLLLVSLCFLGVSVGATILLFGDWVSLALIILAVASVFVSLVYLFTIQRLHDCGCTGWVALLLLIPGVNVLLLLTVCVYPGDRADNRYGSRPPSNRLWHWWAGLVAPIIMVALLGSAFYVVGGQLYTVYAEQVRLGQDEEIPTVPDDNSGQEALPEDVENQDEAVYPDAE